MIFAAISTLLSVSVVFGSEGRTVAMQREPSELMPSHCLTYLLGRPEPSEIVRAKADEILSWISLTHPILRRAVEQTSDFEFILDFPYFPTGFAIPPLTTGNSPTYFDEINRFWPHFLGRRHKARLKETASLVLDGEVHTPATVNAEFLLTARLIVRAHSMLKWLGHGLEGSSDLKPCLVIRCGMPDPEKLRQAVDTKWVNALSQRDLAHMRTMAGNLDDERVLQALVRGVHTKLRAIVTSQQALSAISVAAKSTKIENLRKAMLDVLDSSVFAFMPRSPVTDPARLPTPAVEPRLEIAASFDTAAIDTLVRERRTSLSHDLSSISIVEISVDVSEGLDVIRSTLEQVTRARGAAFDWSQWRRSFGANDEWWSRFGRTISQFRTASAAEMRRLARARSGFERLRVWAERLNAHLANERDLDTAATDGDRGTRAALDSILTQLPLMSVMIEEALDSFEARFSRIAAQMDQIAKLNLLLAKLEVARLSGSFAVEKAAVEAALALLVEGASAVNEGRGL